MTNEERLMEIEIKIAHQEDLVDSLSRTIYQQQKKIDHLETLCAALAKHVKQSREADGGPGPIDERPPHY